MSRIDWLRALDLDLAHENLEAELVGDWHKDPWGWPELDYVHNKEPSLLAQNCSDEGSKKVALIDVPKESWGTRPAVVLDPLDRLMYQSLVDRLSINLIGDLSRNTFGWRLHADTPTRGKFSHNSFQWKLYRGHLSSLSDVFPVALKSDIVSCFASMPMQLVEDEIRSRAAADDVTERLVSFLHGFNRVSNRSGLPQRSTASAAIANMMLRPLDDVLFNHSESFPNWLRSEYSYLSFARWMDDLWLFGDDPAKMRKAQVALHYAAQAKGLHLNASKTSVLEGSEVERQAKEVEHSAVDNGLVADADTKPLEELVEKVIASREDASKTALKFACSRMLRHGINYKVDTLRDESPRIPHGADSIAPLMKANYQREELEEWFLDYCKSDWASFQWSIAHYGLMFTSGIEPRKEIKDYFAEVIDRKGSTLPLLALAAQRLSAWDKRLARGVMSNAIDSAENPHVRRVLALSALSANESRSTVRGWLGQLRENDVTLRMLEARNFSPPNANAGYAN